MVTFFGDVEAAGAGEFLDTAGVGIRYTIPAATVTPRIYFPAVAPAGSLTVRIYSTGGALVAGPLSLTSTNLSAWNSTSSVVLAAGTYDVIWSTTRYKAISGFFSGGSITRGSITAVGGRFGTPDNAPTNNSTAGFVVDIDVVASGTSFNQDYSFLWNVRNTFTKDYSLPWNVRNTFTKDYVLQWNVSGTAFTKDYVLQWRVLNTFTKDYALQWNVRAQFTKDTVLLWRVLSNSALAITVWSSGQEVPATIEGVWNGSTVVPYVAIEIV
jgi:hypothetical protein